MKGATTTPSSWLTLASMVPPSPPSAAVTLIRERNGWCLQSARVWLALEVKEIPYNTRLSLDPEPSLRWEDDEKTLVGADQILRVLDSQFPDSSPLWPPAGVSAAEVTAMVDAFHSTMPRARESSRAGFLFSADEGFLYDALPADKFTAALDTTESLLGAHADGPFFCGAALSAADVYWAPLLERWDAQLCCLVDGELEPRGGAWPRLADWYAA
jgi:glutathione S-transferase